jgi:hypothetical protein
MAGTGKNTLTTRHSRKKSKENTTLIELAWQHVIVEGYSWGSFSSKYISGKDLTVAQMTHEYPLLLEIKEMYYERVGRRFNEGLGKHDGFKLGRKYRKTCGSKKCAPRPAVHVRMKLKDGFCICGKDLTPPPIIVKEPTVTMSQPIKINELTLPRGLNNE